MRVVMNNLSNLSSIIFLFSVCFIACGNDSGNNSDDLMDFGSFEESLNLDFNTFEGLNAEMPCNKELNGDTAHVKRRKQEYVCIYDSIQHLGQWINSLSIDSILSLSSSSISNPTSSALISSSSSFQVSSSSKVNWEYLNPNISYGEIIDERDGQIYKTVLIGEQLWMAENLNYRYLVKTASEDSSSFCGSDNCTIYGRRYLWSAAMDSVALFSKNGKGCGNGRSCNYIKPVRGVCPEHWHLPDSTEWSILINSVSSLWAAKYTPQMETPDISGFSRLDQGKDCNKISCYNEEKATFFWGSTDLGGLLDRQEAYFVPSWYGFPASYYAGGDKKDTYSIRCLKDAPNSINVQNPSSIKASWAFLNPDVSYGEFTDERDGQIYKTVDIEEMTWMAENLNYAYVGTPQLSENSNYTYYVFDEIIDSLYTCPNDEIEKCKIYGRLYSWDALLFFPENDSSKICPKGWHVPDTTEFIKLKKHQCSQKHCSSNGLFVAKGIDDWGDAGFFANNETGFSMLPAIFGNCKRYDKKCTDYSGDDQKWGKEAFFWAAVKDPVLGLLKYKNLVLYSGATLQQKNLALENMPKFASIRCVKNNP